MLYSQERSRNILQQQHFLAFVPFHNEIFNEFLAPFIRQCIYELNIFWHIKYQQKFMKQSALCRVQRRVTRMREDQKQMEHVKQYTYESDTV